MNLSVVQYSRGSIKENICMYFVGDCAQVFGGCTKHEDCCSNLYCSLLMGKCYEDKKGEREKGINGS